MNDSKLDAKGLVELKAKNVNVMNEIAIGFNASASTFRWAKFWTAD